MSIPRPQQSPLTVRLAQKKQELQSLQQLQNMSADLVGQLEALQEKLDTLADGTEG
jgi:DASH complex subunit DAD2